MQKLIKIYHVVQELRTFLLTANGRTGNSHSDDSAGPMIVQYSQRNWSDKGKMLFKDSFSIIALVTILFGGAEPFGICGR